MKSDVYSVEKADIKKNKLKRALFIIAMIVVPMANFVVFYVYVNFNSIMLAFQDYSAAGDMVYTFKWFRYVWDAIFVDGSILIDLRNTMIYFCTGLFVILPLTSIIAYFIYKKIFMYKFFRVIFFLPNIISSVVLTTLYKSILGGEGPVAPVVQAIFNLAQKPYFFTDKHYATWAILAYCIWTGFGTNLLLMTGAMARIPEDVLEAARLDGVSISRELVSIIIPLIWPTMTTVIVMQFVGLFTSSGPILLFTKGEYETSTISYFIFASVYFGNGNVNYASAVGIFFTLISVPVVLGIKKLMERWQDAIEY